MIIQIGTEVDESRILWKHNEKDDWRRADIDDLIEAYESRPILCKDCKYFDPPHVEKDGERHEYNEFPQEAFDPFGIGVSVKYGTNVGSRCTYYNMFGYPNDKSVYVPDDNYCGRAKRKKE